MMKIAVAILIVFSCGVVHAAGWHYAKIEKITTYLNGGVYVFVDSEHECGSKQIGMDASAAGFKNVYSALLAYEAQRKTIAFAVQSCTGAIAMIDRILSQP